jgi:hypothetical protein
MKYKYIGPDEFLTSCRFKDEGYYGVCDNGSCPGHVMGTCPFTHKHVPFPEFDVFFVEVHDE